MQVVLQTERVPFTVGLPVNGIPRGCLRPGQPNGHTDDALGSVIQAIEGATLQQPGWMGEQIGFAPFPVPRVADEAGS